MKKTIKVDVDKKFADLVKGSKNFETLSGFYLYCLTHKEERFWQALRNYFKAKYILKSSHFDWDMFDPKWVKKNEKTLKIEDTFYIE